MAGSSRNRKLSMGVLSRAIAFPFRNLPALVKLGLFPALIAVAISYAVEAAYPGYPAALAVSELALTIGGVIFAVGVHRFIISGDPARWTIFRFSSAERAYSLALLLFFIFIVVEYFALASALWAFDLLPEGAFSANWLLEADFSFEKKITGLLVAATRIPVEVRIVVWLSMFLFTLWVFVRLALMFPHAAVTGHISSAVSWRSMRGNVLRLLFASIGLIVIIVVVHTLIMFPLGKMWMQSLHPGMAPATDNLTTSEWGVLLFIIQLLLEAVAIAMVVALFSYAYKDLVADAERMPEKQAAAADENARI